MIKNILNKIKEKGHQQREKVLKERNVTLKNTNELNQYLE